ncbi:DJ-1/PfpI family protein [Sphingomonas sp. BGYR3]|uniref:DJ-1/PfpI family protein n=1 Tax=Sphingomonas sp. BGYR3 TaxID=2975483 RepID=UPI0021A71721|nr:DJ-1/PfpI family protein [Sphingomonas sp. BGYR3]MDG5488633.1 DJ-1/PfpI family protein [Sphingomonas sp. BGYR3]
MTMDGAPRIAFLLFPGMTQLDLTGPAQVLSRLGTGPVHYVARTLDPVPTDSGFAILPTARMSDVTAADILMVPGGMAVEDVIDDPESLAWVQRVGEQAQWVTSVCTGALILGAAGLLRGYRATTHWMWHHHLARFGAEPVRARTVIDRNRATGGGVTAGIDFALALTAAIQGEDHARLIQLALEYDPAPPFDSGSPDRAMAETVADYRARADRLAPDREARLMAAAKRLGF